MSEKDASNVTASTNHPANAADANTSDNANAAVAITTTTHNGATTNAVDQLLTQTNSPHVFRSLDESPVIVRPPSAIVRPSPVIDRPLSAIVLPSPVIDRPPQAAPMGNAPTRDRDSKNEVNSCCIIRSPKRQRKSVERNGNNDDVTKQNGVDARDESNAHDSPLSNSDQGQGSKKATRGTVTFEDSTLSVESATSEEEYFDIENPEDYLEHRSQSIIYDYGGEGCDRLSFLQKAVDAERQKETKKDEKALVETSSVDKVSSDNETEVKNNDNHVSDHVTDGSSVDGASVGKRVVDDMVPALEEQETKCNANSTETPPKPVTPPEILDARITDALPNTIIPTEASESDIVETLPKSAHSVETRDETEPSVTAASIDTCSSNYTDVSHISEIPVETSNDNGKSCKPVSDERICTDNQSDDSNDLEYSQYDNIQPDLNDNRADSPQGVEEELLVCDAHAQQENMPKSQRDLDSMFDKILEPLMIECPPNELSVIENTDTGSVYVGRSGKLNPEKRPDSSGPQQLSLIGSDGSMSPRRAHPASESSEGELSTPSGEAVTSADIFAQTDSDCSGALTPNNIEKRKQMDLYKPDSIEDKDAPYGGPDDNCAELEELQAVLRKPDDQSSNNLLCSGVTLRSPDFMSNGRGSRGSTCYSRTESDLSISEHRDDVSTDGILGDDEDECEVLLCKTYTEPQQGSEVLLSCTIVNSAYKDSSRGDYWSDAHEEDFRLFEDPLEPEEESESTDTYKDARLKMKDIHVHLQNLRMQMEQLNDDLLSMSDDDEYLSVTN